MLKKRAPKLRRLTHAAIRPFGMIIDRACVRDDGRKNCYGVLLKERSSGWRIGYLIVRERTIAKLEHHPDSLETFEPVKGLCVIALARPGQPDTPKIFLLDKPVVLRKGVWHDVAALSKRAEVKIVENIDVKVTYRPLKNPLRF